MCELFGVCAREKIKVNNQLKEFFSHSKEHPHGWGMAIFCDDNVMIEKEPLKAIDSFYLKSRIRHTIEVKNMIAHIRLATIGATDYENCHPFMKTDNKGRKWTLIHNGTLFNGYATEKYRHLQEGRTDSERILCYFIDEINKKQEILGRKLEKKERFDLLDQLVCNLAKENKLNLLFFDGEIMYVHTNFRSSLHYAQLKEGILFSTEPLTGADWKQVPFTRLLAFQEGQLIFEGTEHGLEYIYKEEDYRYLLMESAEL